MQQVTKYLKRMWGGGERDALRVLVEEFAQKFEYGEIAVNPANLAAGAAAQTAVALPSGSIGANGDLIFVQPPADLEAGLVPMGAVISGGNIQVRLYNPTAAGIDGASKTWTYLIEKPGKLSVL